MARCAISVYSLRWCEGRICGGKRARRLAKRRLRKFVFLLRVVAAFVAAAAQIRGRRRLCVSCNKVRFVRLLGHHSSGAQKATSASHTSSERAKVWEYTLPLNPDYLLGFDIPASTLQCADLKRPKRNTVCLRVPPKCDVRTIS